MAFEREPIRTPVDIGDMQVQLNTANAAEARSPAATFELQIMFDDSSIRVASGDLIPHLTPAQRNSLLSIMADLRVLARSQILP